MANPILTTKLAPIAEAHDRYQLRRHQAIAWLVAAGIGVILLFLDRQGITLFAMQLPALVVAVLAYTTWRLSLIHI